MSPAGRKPSPDQMANLFRRMLEGANPRDGHPYLPTDDEFRAATGWFDEPQSVPPARGTPPEPEPREEPPEPEEETVAPPAPPAPLKRKGRFQTLEL